MALAVLRLQIRIGAEIRKPQNQLQENRIFMRVILKLQNSFESRSLIH